MKVLQKSGVKRAVESIRNAFREGELAILIGSVRVDYSGRASSKLETGERVVMLKSDGALLVHRPYGHSPVNWQPPGSRFEVRLSDGNILIDAIRGNPLERVRLFFDRVDLIVTSKLEDKAAFSLHVDEAEIKDAVSFEPKLLEEGFRVVSREKRLPSGFVDLFGVDKNGCLTVVEIKRGVAGREAVIQLKRYIHALKEGASFKIRGILLAPELARGCQELLESLGLEFKRVHPKKCYEILMKHGKVGSQAELDKWI